MKFSRSLQMNAVPEWAGAYIGYSTLKKAIYAFERAAASHSHSSSALLLPLPAAAAPLGTETQYESEEPLLAADDVLAGDPRETFSSYLDAELEKITRFFIDQEKKLYDKVLQLERDVEYVERVNMGVLPPRVSPLLADAAENKFAESTTDDEREHASSPKGSDRVAVTITTDSRTTSGGPSSPRERKRLLSQDAGSSSAASTFSWSQKKIKTERNIYKNKATRLFVALHEFKEYIDLNYTGFSKILKKFDKVLGSDLKTSYLKNVIEVSYPFLDSTKENINDKIKLITSIYARIAADNKRSLAELELRSNLRDHIVMERNTIWRDMIERERRATSLGVKQNALLGRERKVFSFTVGVREFTFQLPSASFFLGIVSLAAFAAVLLTPPFNDSPEQQGCLAILLLASMFWAFEIIPLFATSILIPLLVVVLRVLRNPADGSRMPSKDAAKQIFADMFSSVIMLLLGGFTIAAALSKHHIAKRMAAAVLKRAGTTPAWILTTNMMVATFASMWISNVAAPVLCFSLIQPILRTLPHKSPYAKCLVMGIALASNIGGMASPIASPQNLIAIQNMKPAPGWITWFAVALPLCLLLDGAVALLLIAIYRPGEHANVSPAPPEVYHGTEEKLTGKQYFVIGVTLLTIVLWCVEPAIEHIVGHMGIIAIIPMVVFFGTGVLNKEDFNSFLWTVIMLAMGGIALGSAVKSSGLLRAITDAIAPQLNALTFWQCLCVITLVVGVVTTFISHTVGALILFPVIQSIGMNLTEQHPNILVFASALMCSGGMGLPVSSFPNMNAISLEDSTGIPWLEVTDFLKSGIIATAFTGLCIISIGYGLMLLAGVS